MADFDPSQLFFAVTFTIVPSDKIDEQQAQKLREQLEANGATYIPLTKDGEVDDVLAHSHIISTHVDFPDYNRALDNNCYIVKPAWVEHSIAKGRRVVPRQYSPDPALIFQDVVISCADLPRGDKDAITAGVMALGGQYSAPLTKLVTHVVSLSEEHDKVRVVREKRLNCLVVLPHWFDDCLKLGKRINERAYTLPNPEILDADIQANGKAPAHENVDLGGATSAIAGNPPDLSQSSTRRNITAFRTKKVFFGDDLNIHNKLERTLKELVGQAGGEVTGLIEQCDIYIGHYREGNRYAEATKQEKTVANLAWFYDVLVRDHWTNPLNKLLHYPVPKEPIPGFENLRISISNYTGDSRQYLENLITEAGAEFTKTMKAENTHLVTAHTQSEKCEAAREWNVNIINHLWVEESYAKCEAQALTNTRYTHFPARAHLSEIVGQTQIDMQAIWKHYISKYDPNKEEEGPQVATTLSAKSSNAANGASKAASPQRKKALVSDTSVNGAQGTEAEDDEDEANQEGDEENVAPKTVKKKGRKVVDAATPGLERRISSERDTDGPPSTGRASKLRAQEQLDKAKADILLFQKEMKRKGGVTHGKKRSSTDVDNEEGSNNEQDKVAGTQRQAKRAKAAPVASSEPVPVTYKMMVSGDERWLSNPKKEEEDKKMLRSLGIQLTTNAAECSLLCAPRLIRTRKFICALANAPTVTHISFLDSTLSHKTFDTPEDYPLQDSENESKFGIRLTKTLARAKDNNRRLLRGWTIYVTEHVNGGFDTYKDVIDSNGGTAVIYRGRTGVQLPRRRLRLDEDPDAGLESQNQGGDEETDFVYLVSGTADEDVKMWATFRKMATKQGLEARIVKTDWLLNLAMRQCVEWDDKWELKDGVGKGGSQGRR